MYPKRLGLAIIPAKISGRNYEKPLISSYAQKINKQFGKTLGNTDIGINDKISSINSKIINGTKMIYTTPTLNIYTQGELDMKKIVNEVNKYFGSQY